MTNVTIIMILKFFPSFTTITTIISSRLQVKGLRAFAEAVIARFSSLDPLCAACCPGAEAVYTGLHPCRAARAWVNRCAVSHRNCPWIIKAPAALAHSFRSFVSEHYERERAFQVLSGCSFRLVCQFNAPFSLQPTAETHQSKRSLFEARSV